MTASITKTGDDYRGALLFEHHGTSSAPRQVHGSTCAEVTDALAVVAALALRPSSTSPPSSARTAPAAADAALAPGVASARDASKVSPPRAPAAPPLKATHTWPVPFRPGDQAVPVEAGNVRFESVMGVTALGGVAFGIVPGVAMPRLELELARANFVTLPNAESYMVGPLWRVRLTLLGDVDRHSADLTTSVGGQFVGMGSCYAPVFDSGALELLACLELGAGLLAVRTKDATGATLQKKTIGLGTLGIGAEASYAIGRHFHAALRLGFDVGTGPVTAERTDGSRIFESSRLSGYGMLGLGGHF